MARSRFDRAKWRAIFRFMPPEYRHYVAPNVPALSWALEQQLLREVRYLEPAQVDWLHALQVAQQ